jgi:hypothetical protein
MCRRVALAPNGNNRWSRIQLCQNNQSIAEEIVSPMVNVVSRRITGRPALC